MRPATERDLAHEPHPQEPPPAMLTRTDVFRGGMVILLAVVIGAFLLSQGLDEPDLETTAASETADGDDTGATGTADDSTTTPEADDAGDGLEGAGTADLGGTDQTEAGTASTQVTTVGDDPASPAATEPPLRSPSEVKVLVLNGAGTQGIAARGTEMLKAASYITAAPKNAEFPSRGPSAVYYADGYDREAQLVAQVFSAGLEDIITPLDPANPPVADTQSSVIIVYVGNDDRIPVL